ncbi:carbohydrate ABC transporter permease [Streptomyces bluensis]|uniref:carbohydrate ABC transporter permease n=1 Tax=Streptomyces bluensis TaxID=33897 RepID=UPI00106437F8|nr:carbohydrate ABC transporter permease [Streptomyces bluensis]GGZ76680.1 glycerol-3-phosphate ABC transporter permease [Streptomyces bluensis]
MRRLQPGSVLRWLWLGAVVLVVAFPVYVTVVTALLPQGDVAAGRLLPVPGRLTLDNVRAALDSAPLARQYLVSVAVTALQAVAQLTTAALAAYALVFPRWRGRGVAFALVLATLAFPGESLVIPNFELVTGLGLRDTLLGIVIPYLAAGYAVFLLRQAFLALPRETWEAARLDGCGELRALLHVVLPMARPQLVTAAMWCALSAWNGYFWPLLITDSPQRRTIQVGLAQLVVDQAAAPAVIYAGTLLVLLPTLLLVLFGQRFLVRGLAARVTT